MENPNLSIKGLREKLGVSDEQLDSLRKLRVQAEMQEATMMMVIWRSGGNIHGANKTKTTKRRKANKVARKQRRENRVRS